MINKLQLAFIRVRDFFRGLFCKHEWSEIFYYQYEIDHITCIQGYSVPAKVCKKCGKII